MKSILIRNGRVLVDDRLEERNVLIEDNKITLVTRDSLAVDEIINARDKVVLPGIIDPHVHFREPGQEYKEDFLSGSRAAASGGVTTVLDMPNNKPPILKALDLEGKRELAKKSIVNYGFHFGSSADTISEIANVKNIASVKVFMNETTGNMLMEDDSYLGKVFESYKMISVHAEGEAVKKASKLIKATKKGKLYFCHMSSEDELKMARKIGKKIFIEATPHHLFLTKDDSDRLGAFGRMKPKLKTKEDQNFLWEAVSNGTVDTVGSDHAPHTMEEKKSDNPPFGVPGVETLLPLMLNAVNEGKLSLGKMVKLCCENPATIFRIKNKGFLLPEYDADLVIVDMKKEKTIKNEELITKCKWSPFNGKTLKGWPITTIIGGKIVYNDCNINDIKGKEVVYDERKSSKGIG